MMKTSKYDRKCRILLKAGLLENDVQWLYLSRWNICRVTPTCKEKFMQKAIGSMCYGWSVQWTHANTLFIARVVSRSREIRPIKIWSFPVKRLTHVKKTLPKKVNGRPITGLHQEGVYTYSGISCPECIHQFFCCLLIPPKEKKTSLVYALWQEIPKLVNTFWTCKPVDYMCCLY